MRTAATDKSAVMPRPSFWTADHVARIADQTSPSSPVIGDADFARVAEGSGLWDAWPVQRADGSPVALVCGSQLWMALSAPRSDDPDERHAQARIHLLRRVNDQWQDLGPAMPEGFAPGSREWSGSAVLSSNGATVTLYFTAAGRRNETAISFEQRIFSAEADLKPTGQLAEWRDLREIVARDPPYYMTTEGGAGVVGKIKAFRDPGFFRDPRTGGEYLLFAGSSASSESDFNGVVGIACRDADAATGWSLMPPIVSADGLNNELERPHVVYRDGFYYLFWSTQRHVFNPAGPTGPTGLYGMVSRSLLEGWEPINGTGLVIANPATAPAQAFSWLVLPDGSVTSFVDDWGSEGKAERRFGGTFAPFLHLVFEGHRVCCKEASK